MDIYKSSGIIALSYSIKTGEGKENILALLENKISAFTGNTGVGKSSMLNSLFPEFEIQTAEISKKLGRGRHTTRHAELYKLAEGGYIADTPGFSTFETNRYDIIRKEEIAGCFREFSSVEGECRFRDCAHICEKGCVIIDAVRRGEISESRHASYCTMYDEAKKLKECEIK